MVDEVFDPDPILDTWLGDPTFTNASANLDYSAVQSGALYVDVNVTNIDQRLLKQSSTFNMTFSSASSGESLQSGFYLGGDNPFWVSRGNLRGFDNIFFTDKFSTADIYYDSSETYALWRMQAFIDRSIYEVFVDDGIHAGTVVFYPSDPLTVLTMSTKDLPAGSQVTATVWSLKSAWASQGDNEAVVHTTSPAFTAHKHRSIYDSEFFT
jgi:beta-fructofuranosidase